MVSADGGGSAGTWAACSIGAGAGAWLLGTMAACAGLGRESTVGRMLTASEMTSATTPMTNTDVNALPTRRKGLRPSSVSRISAAANSSTASAPTGASWVSAAASPA